ncbi:MAG: aldehyde ferredoxin oxidoreductase N-terminal domain-containing protein [Desulfohalobiaceae bacterium]
MNNKWYGWCGKVLYVDLDREEVQSRELSRRLVYDYLGQSGSGAKLLVDLNKPGMHPLEPAAPLIFGVGPLGGTPAPCSGRFTLSFKSPLTGIFADSNCGGHFGPELKMAGYDHLIITGRAKHPVYLWIDNDRVRICDARHLWGLDTLQTDQNIKQELGENSAQVACIGPAGENMVLLAAVIANLSRAAARCGPGAVMGSKNLKAVAVRGDKGLEFYEPAAFAEAVQEAQEAILQDPLYEQASSFGT